MYKTKWTVAAALTAASFLMGITGKASAAPKVVEVHLPSFQVNINSYSPLFDYLPYPPIVYNDITYIPMTWDNSLRLNLALDWKEDEGLTVSQRSNLAEEPMSGPEIGEKINDAGHTYHAQIAAYPITVNGKRIDNEQEPYPILSFRDITYFPLTWRFTHDEFHWATAWSSRDGLRVVSRDSKYMLSSILSSNETELIVGTRLYGVFRINKSFTGAIQSVSYDDLDKTAKMDSSDKQLLMMEKHPEVMRGQTHIEGDSIVMGKVKLLSVQQLLDEANSHHYSRTFTEKDISLEDTVIPLGRSRLIRISTGLLDQDSILLLEHEGHVTALDKNLFYRMIPAGNGVFWLSSAYKQSETHTYFSRHEQHVWLIDRDGNVKSVNQLLGGAPMIRVLTGLQDGSILTLASDNDWEATPIDLYRVYPDGKSEKLFSSLHGKVHADATGEIFLLDPEYNRITKLATGESVELTERMLLLMSSGQPQMIPDNKPGS